MYIRENLQKHMKFGTIFYTFLGISAILIGIYLLQYHFILTIIFFIGAFINGTFIYMEYKSHKIDKIEYDEISVSEVIIKYSRSGRIIVIATYSIFVLTAILFLSLVNFEFNLFIIFVIVLFSGAAFYFIIKIISEIKNMSKNMISINEKGIQLIDNERYLWDEIQLEKIITKRLVAHESKHDYKPEINYLYFIHNGEKKEVKIDDFDITDYQLAQVLKIFRSRYNSGL